jgi:sulfate transport system substrate-binding protein
MKIVIHLLLAVLMVRMCGCSGMDTGTIDAGSDMLVLGAYTVPKEAYQKEIIPAFKRMWKQKTGRDVIFQESYMASGAQSRTIAAGFEADIAALSLEKDFERLQEKGLLTHNWKKGKYNGFVTNSVVVIAFREGNPKQIKGWQDLEREDVDVIYPSPKTSGGAMWFVNAIYGAVLKLTEIQTGTRDFDAAYRRLKAIQRRVKVMDKSGRASVTTFENGIGDVLLTYENEAMLRQKQGKCFPFIVPRCTILIENPIVLIDKHVDKHGNRELAEAFIEFVWQRESQKSFARYGFRPVDKSVLEEFSAEYPIPEYLFDVESMGGWSRIHSNLYASRGVWDKIILEIAGES